MTIKLISTSITDGTGELSLCMLTDDTATAMSSVMYGIMMRLTMKLRTAAASRIMMSGCIEMRPDTAAAT